MPRQNVRQLWAVLENAVALSDGGVIEPNALWLPPRTGEYPALNQPPSLNLEDVEAWAVRQALQRYDGTLAHAAKLLGIHRETLVAKMKKYGIEKDA